MFWYTYQTHREHSVIIGLDLVYNDREKVALVLVSSVFYLNLLELKLVVFFLSRVFKNCIILRVGLHDAISCDNFKKISRIPLFK